MDITFQIDYTQRQIRVNLATIQMAKIYFRMDLHIRHIQIIPHYGRWVVILIIHSYYSRQKLLMTVLTLHILQ